MLRSLASFSIVFFYSELPTQLLLIPSDYIEIAKPQQMTKSRLIPIYLLIFLVFTSCENEPLGQMNINKKVLEPELLELVKGVSDSTIECIEFNYPFILFVFNEQGTLMTTVVITSDLEFSTLLGSLEETTTISINYPITGTLSNGEMVDIHSNMELKQAIDACRTEELKRRCNRTLPECVWKVGLVEGFPNSYEGAYYKLRYDGSVQFHLNDDVYFGTWVTLSIGQEVFLNIDLNDNPEIEAFWNHNWLVDLRSDPQIELSDNGIPVLMEKDCSIPCVAEGYRVCEMLDAPGQADFILEDYTPCIPIPSTHDVVSAVSYSFYETEENAQLGIDPIPSTSYLNTTNPQTIYARVAYKETNKLLLVFEFLIEAIPCTDG